jgi:hypothetical protein
VTGRKVGTDCVNAKKRRLGKFERGNMGKIQRRLDSMFNIQSEFADQSGSLWENWKRRGKVWMRVLRGRGPAAHVYRDRYSPAPLDWGNMPSGNVYEKIISRDRDSYFEYVRNCSQFMKKFSAISVAKPDNATEPFWNNEFFSSFDSVVLYSLIAQRKPAAYMEVGSGNSTKFVRRAISDHGLDTKITSVDPYPRAEIDALCNEVLRVRAETLPVEKFAALNAGDVLFIDNSHRSFQNSDVTFFFTKILPNLKPGVIYGIHDIFLPHDYPAEWAMRFYNEQYLLMMYLLGGAGGDEILFPVAYMSNRKEVEKAMLGEHGAQAPWGDKALQGGAFWMIKA